MLVLSRKSGERIRIGDSIEITVLKISGGRVKLGFTGPTNILIQREEINRARQAAAAQAATQAEGAEASAPQSAAAEGDALLTSSGCK